MWIQIMIVTLLVYAVIYYSIMRYTIKAGWFEDLEEEIDPNL